ncbi:hypothetical protein BMS3Abin04_01178 [bacterium BMS3Abin04]|nr:hypothetical protein BMS3Abin04_01178 [bacterium BMS3Abin04]
MKTNKLKIRIIVVPLLLTCFVLLQSCGKATENKKAEVKETKIIKIEKYCFINRISRKDGKVSAGLDFIEYKKIKDLNSSLKQKQKIELPNGYCYVNDEEKTVDYPVSNKATIVMQTMDYDNDGNFKFNEIVSLARLVDFFSKPESQRLKHEPFKVIFKNDKIVSIKEIYIP